jgi:hypothetical protein
MSRKKALAFKLRKPAAADVDAFVAGDTEPAKTSRRPGVQTSKRQAAKNGPRERERQRTTVYFSPDTRKRLAVYCAEHKAEMSEIVDQAVSKFLGRT